MCLKKKKNCRRRVWYIQGIKTGWEQIPQLPDQQPHSGTNTPSAMVLLLQERQAVPLCGLIPEFLHLSLLPFLLPLRIHSCPCSLAPKISQKQTENLEQAQEVCKISSKTFLRMPTAATLLSHLPSPYSWHYLQYS